MVTFPLKKNTTIINCGIKGLDMKTYVMRPDEQSVYLKSLSTPDLEKRFKRLDSDPKKCEKNTEELIQAPLCLNQRKHGEKVEVVEREVRFKIFKYQSPNE